MDPRGRKQQRRRGLNTDELLISTVHDENQDHDMGGAGYSLNEKDEKLIQNFNRET